jgi:hypothetical protein
MSLSIVVKTFRVVWVSGFLIDQCGLAQSSDAKEMKIEENNVLRSRLVQGQGSRVST